MTFRPFVPTHQITRGVMLAPVVSEVMLDADPVGDGPAYTRAEFADYGTPRFTVVDGEWHLDGVRCTGLVVEPLTDQTTPETVARIALPESPDWLTNDYPQSARLRRDGSVVVRGLFGARAYRHVHQFCRAWRVMVSFAVTPSMVSAVGVARPDEIMVRYTGEAFALFPHDHAPDRKYPSFLAALQATRLSPDRVFRGSVSAIEDHASFRSVVGSLVEHDHLLWEYGSVWGRTDAVGFDHWVKPRDVVPLRGAIDATKIAKLSGEMRLEGWVGTPVLAERMPYGGYVAWTGRHRILAARSAGLPEIPVILVDPIAWARVHGAPCPYGAVYDTRDDLHRAVSLAMCGDMVAASVMAHELSKVTR